MANSYKSTMNLPQTDFAMKANLPSREPERLAKWEEEHLYWKVLEKNKDGKPFVLHDGPPYANGPIHIGHAFNKILKDFVIKSHAQRGFYTPYVPGWDCHGQPIEHMVEEKLGPEKMAKIDQPTLRRLCHEWAEKYVNIQRDGFKRLGVNADWDHPYLTFQPNFEAGNVEIFKQMYLDGQIYRGSKPIHWCKHCHTALAEAEIEYGDEVSPSIFVRFKMHEMPKAFAEAGATGDVFVLIWTTTPWTLPANTAVSLAPDADYCLVTAQGAQMVMALDLVEQVAGKCEWDSFDIMKGADGEPVTMKGVDFAYMTYERPIFPEKKGVIIYGDHVTLEDGTGCVHTAPGHGQDDYLVASKFDGVETLMPVDDDGKLTKDGGPFAGLDTDDANPVIIQWLREKGTLAGELKINHSYPHCWRCHEPVIFRATDQWFVSMDKTGLRDKALDAINNKVRWIPEWASNRIGSMVADRPDWCISRQRSWGVPIPVFRCAECGEIVATEETFDAVIDLFYNEGADAWFTKQPSEYLPEGTHCEKCGCTELKPEKDILDVWWESGVTHNSVLRHRANEGLVWPADMYLEGSDQHRGWFQSSLLTSVGAYGEPPYKAVMHCGFTVDENGEKMSKSKGNGIMPADLVKVYGVDAYRYYFMSDVQFGHDGNISIERMTQVYNADLANTWGNLVSRVCNMVKKYYDFKVPQAPESAVDNPLREIAEGLYAEYDKCMTDVDFTGAVAAVQKLAGRANLYVEESAPWNLAKSEETAGELAAVIYNTLEAIRIIALYLAPFMPNTSAEVFRRLGLGDVAAITDIEAATKWGQLPAGNTVEIGDPLFPRLDVDAINLGIE